MKIGLTHTGNPEKHQFYLDWLRANEAIDIVTLSTENNNADELNKCDALVLSGGVDVHPRFYGNNNDHYQGAPEKFNEKRDEFEIAAFRLAQKNKIPVLGICRGMQLINIIHNGTLVQNLEEKKLNTVHVGNPDKSHNVTIQDGTILHNIIGDDKSAVNSAHHQGIDKLGEGLLINAVSEDGIPEGVERKNKDEQPFLLAIQWHPERMFRFHLENTAASKAIRNRFIEEVKKSMDLK